MAFHPENQRGSREWKLKPFRDLQRQQRAATRGVQIGRVKLTGLTNTTVSVWEGEYAQQD